MEEKIEFVEVPILERFDAENPIGTVCIRRDALPVRPDWVLSLGFRADKMDSLGPTEYSLVCMSIATDAEYEQFLKQRRQ